MSEAIRCHFCGQKIYPPDVPIMAMPAFSQGVYYFHTDCWTHWGMAAIRKQKENRTAAGGDTS